MTRTSLLALFAAALPAAAGAQQKPKRLADPNAVAAEVHRNFAFNAYGQVLPKRGYSPQGISCGDVCRVFELGPCYEKGKPEKGTYGTFGSCTNPLTSSRAACVCDHQRRDFGFFWYDAVTVGEKVFRRSDDFIYRADPETLKVDRVAVPSVGKASLFAAGPWVGLVPSQTPTKQFIRLDTRSMKVRNTVPKDAEKFATCGYLPGVGPRAWVCATADAEPRRVLIDAETSLQHALPTLDFDPTQRGIQAHWDGKSLWIARKTGSEWDVRKWSAGAKSWQKGDERPAKPVEKPDDEAAADIYRAGGFKDQIRSTGLAPMAGMGAFHGPRTGSIWIGDTVYIPTHTSLLAFNVGAEKWTEWPVGQSTHEIYHSLFRVGDTVVFGQYVLDRASGELRPLPPNLNAVFAGTWALVYKDSCPRGATCRPLPMSSAFPDVVVWKLNPGEMPSNGAIKPVTP